MLLDPLPLSQTVTPSRTPSPLERDALYGRPLITCHLLFSVILSVSIKLRNRLSSLGLIYHFQARNMKYCVIYDNGSQHWVRGPLVCLVVREQRLVLYIILYLRIQTQNPISAIFHFNFL